MSDTRAKARGGGNARRARASAPVSRRRFLASASAAALAGAGALAFGAGGLAGCGRQEQSETLSILDVADDDVVTLDGFTQIEKPDKLYKVKDIATLPAGAMLKSSGGDWAAALVPASSASSVLAISLVNLKDGTVNKVLDQPVGHAEGFQIYDVACSSDVLVWVESDYLTGDWRVYSASISVKKTTETVTEEVPWEEVYGPDEDTAEEGGESGEDDAAEDEDALDHPDTVLRDREVTKVEAGIGSPMQLDAGDAAYDAPDIEAVGGQPYWIVQPAEGGPNTDEDSLLKTSGGVACTSRGRFNGGLSASGNVLTAMPRADTASGVFYQLTALQGGGIVATQVLPRSFKPNTAIYMNNAFSFSIPASYDYGGGIAHVGTYYPMQNGQWLRLTKQPITAPGMCNGWLFCKSGSRTVFVDMAGQRYFTIDAPADCESQGDYSARVGDVDAVCNYASIVKVNGSKRKKSVKLRRITIA